MKRTWIVGGLLLLVLLLLTVRERLTNYEGALQDLGQTSEQTSPLCPTGMTLNPGKGVLQMCEKKTPTGNTETTAATCLPGSEITKRGTNWVCVKSATPPENVTVGVGAPGYVEDTNLTAMLRTMGVGSQPTGPGRELIPGSTGVGATTGTTTGGTSGMSFGPTNQSKLIGKTVWGPASKGLGETTAQTPSAGDSSKSTPYPVLLGGETGKSSTRIEGVGVVPPSGSGLGGVMPSSTALGTDANSGFLPYSRQPGDQEIVPDPYRLAKNFSTSSYSMSKTDPVPFLTDFSAFYK